MSSPLRQRAARAASRAAAEASPTRARGAHAAAIHGSSKLRGGVAAPGSPTSLAGSPARRRATNGSVAAIPLDATAAPPLPDELRGAPLPAELADMWDGVRNRLTRANATASGSIRVVHWQCRSCGNEFRRRVRDHVALGGYCSACEHVPLDAAVASALSKLSVTPSTTKQQQQHQLLERNFSPMLAHTWDKYADRFEPATPFYVSPKLDGVRCIAAWDPVHKQPYFMSRVGNVFESTDWIAEALRPAFLKDPTLVLDGELYFHPSGARDDPDGIAAFNDIVGAVKVHRENRTAAHEKVQQQLQFHAFDVLYAADLHEGAPFVERIAALEKMHKALPAASRKRVIRVKQELLTAADVPQALDDALENGYEGVMVRDPQSPYAYGARAATLLKAKKMHDAEFTVTNVIEGKGRLKGTVGAIECKTDGRRPLSFKAGFGVPDAQRRKFWASRSSLIGKRVTVQYQELTPRGVPRFGQFKCVRSDADGRGFV